MFILDIKDGAYFHIMLGIFNQEVTSFAWGFLGQSASNGVSCARRLSVVWSPQGIAMSKSSAVELVNEGAFAFEDTNGA